MAGCSDEAEKEKPPPRCRVLQRPAPQSAGERKLHRFNMINTSTIYDISYNPTSPVFLTWALQLKIPLLLGSWTRCRHWTSRWFCWSRSWPRQRQPGSTWSATSRKQRLTSNLEFGTLCTAPHRGLYYFQKSFFAKAPYSGFELFI